MARYIQQFSSPYSAQEVSNVFSSYMMSEGFELVDYKGEKVWKKGMGLMTAPQYIKLTALSDGTYLMEAWLKFAILPGVYAGEMGLKGFVGAIPKGFLNNRVNALFGNLNAQMINQNPQAQYNQQQQYAQQQAQYNQQQQYAQQQAQYNQQYAQQQAQYNQQQQYTQPNTQQPQQQYPQSPFSQQNSNNQ